ncbi:MAG: hypothetical protein K9I74_06480 [Bacteroidales bacterium]|nr:hypothetical protein [Bacteroidales bacterium]
MKPIEISPGLRETVPALIIGALQANVKVEESPRELVDLLNREAENIREQESIEDIAALPAVKDTREAYKALGKKPARYRVSSEALQRRIIQGKGLYFINNAVDITNLISIRSGFGICLYDADKIQGEIVFRIAGEGETYRGIGKYDLNLKNLPVFSDEIGPFGSPTSDSERTMIRNETKNILFKIVSFSPNSNMEKWLDHSRELFEIFATGVGFEKQVLY